MKKSDRLPLLRVLPGLVLAVVVTTPALVSAKPVAPLEFCGVYPDAPVCSSGAAACTTCHETPPTRNAYGKQLELVLLPNEPRPLSDLLFLDNLKSALDEIADLDADGDGASNLEELRAGSDVANPQSRPEDDRHCPEGPIRIGWDTCRYDHRYVFRKVHLDFCGYTPTLAELDEFDALGDRKAALHEALDECLDSEFWKGRDGVVWNLANKKILPTASVKSGPDNPGPIPLADYYDDYNFFVYTQIDNNDARDVLVGNYFVERRDAGDGVEETEYTTFSRAPFEDYNVRGQGGAQFVAESRRAGLITHRWFLMNNIMFTGIPRTAAAQAYRAFLGVDISRLEGLYPVEGEPVDYDDKGVQQEACARCHSTLDPLTYPFTRYEGIQGGTGEFRIPFQYNATRLDAFTETDGELIAETPEAGYIFGEPVSDLVEWAHVAANSEQFAQATVRDYWRLLFGEEVRPSEALDFAYLWQSFMTEHEYGVERMLHALIDTEAYGVP